MMEREVTKKHRERWSSWIVGLLLVCGLHYMTLHIDDFESETPLHTELSADVTSEERMVFKQRVLGSLLEGAASLSIPDDPKPACDPLDGAASCSVPEEKQQEMPGCQRRAVSEPA